MVICKIYQNNTLVFSSENIILNSFSLNRFSSSAVAPEFGNVSAGELLFTIDTSTTQNTVERGDLLTVEFKEEDTYSIGEFIVTKVAKRQGAFDVTCLDRMIDLDGKANLSGVTFPLTASAFINQVYGTGLGMTVDISANVHNPTIDDPIFEDGITYRQVLSKVCECMGANAWYTDKLNVGWYEDSGVSYTSAEYFSADLSEKGFDVAVEVTDDVTATPVEINDNGITLRIVANPFLANKTSAERTAIATAIKQNIGTVNWYGGSAVVIPELPYLLPNSIVEIDGKAFPVTSVTHGINENIKLESKIQSDDNAYNYDVARDIATVKKEVGELEENNKHFFYRDDSGVHITMVENDYNTGNNIHIDSDSVDVRQGIEAVASFGFPTRLGSEESNKLVLDDKALKIQDIANRTLFEVGAKVENAIIFADTSVGGFVRVAEGEASLSDVTALGVISVWLGTSEEASFVRRKELLDYTCEITHDSLSGDDTIVIYSDEISSTDAVGITYLRSGDIIGNLIYGINNQPTGNHNVIIGGNNAGSGTDNVIIGDNITANGVGQVILGKYNNTSNTTSKFIIADGLYDGLYSGTVENNALTIGIENQNIRFQTNGYHGDAYTSIARDMIFSADRNISVTARGYEEYAGFYGGDVNVTANREVNINAKGDVDIISSGYDVYGSTYGGKVNITAPDGLYMNDQDITPFYSAGETVTLSSLTGTGYSTGTSGSYYFFLETPKQVPSGKSLSVTSLTATIRGVNGVVASNADVLTNISNMLRATNGRPRILLTGLTNNFKANTPAHIVCSVTFTIAR